MRLGTTIWRACRWRCPACGQGRIFAGWIKMSPSCPSCGLKIDRGPGFYLGSIYFNYGATTVILVVAFFVLFAIEELSPGALPGFLDPTSPQLRWILIAFAIVFPLLFFRHARSFWLAFDEYFDPAGRTEDRADKESPEDE